MNALSHFTIEPFHFRGGLECRWLVLAVLSRARFRLVRTCSRNLREPLKPLVLRLFPWPSVRRSRPSSRRDPRNAARRNADNAVRMRQARREDSPNAVLARPIQFQALPVPRVYARAPALPVSRV